MKYAATTETKDGIRTAPAAISFAMRAAACFCGEAMSTTASIAELIISAVITIVAIIVRIINSHIFTPKVKHTISSDAAAQR
jgi:hypothetical protein